MIKSLGWIFGPLLLAISVAMLALVVLLFLDLRMSSAIPAGFVDEFTDTVNKRSSRKRSTWPGTTRRSSARCSPPA